MKPDSINKLQIMVIFFMIGINHSDAKITELPFGGGLELPGVLCSDVGGENCTAFIPDGEVDPVTGDDISLVSTLSFPDQCDQITDVDVYLNIEHNFIFHLSAFIVSPEGTEIELFSALDEGKGGCDGNNILAYLDDEASAPIFNACNSALTPAVSGSFRPNVNLDALNGEDGDGVWTLRIRDRLSFDDPVVEPTAKAKGLGDQGDLVDWGLNVSCNNVGQGPSTPTSVPATSIWAILIMVALLFVSLFKASRQSKL